MALVVSHLAADFDALARQALRQAPLADLIELRLDRIGHPGEDRLRAFVRECPKPVIVTVHGPEAFGDFAGSVDERLDLLRAAARAGASFVDVDAPLSLELGEVEGKCHRIVSSHATDGTPDDLEGWCEDVRAVLYEGDLIKLVAHARSSEDGLRMLNFVRATGGGLIGFSSGPRGAFTRVLAPLFGSPFTYAAPARMPGEPEPEATAPGQLSVSDLRAALPPPGVSPQTAVFGVVGRPVAHSLSPRVHGMALKAAKLDAVYVAFEPDDLEAFLALAHDDCFRGFSVTAPFKEEAFRLARSHDAAAEATRAANTLLRESHGWRALNTDVGAVRDTLVSALRAGAERPGHPVAPEAARVLVLGTGGAARAALQAVRELGATALVAGRDAGRAQELAAELGAAAVAWDAVGEAEWDALVHCTPVGSPADPGRSPVSEGALRAGTVVLDAVYTPLKTPLLAAARARGCTAVPGAEWFVRQAAAQFRLFTGKDAEDRLLRGALETALLPAAGDAGAGGAAAG